MTNAQFAVFDDNFRAACDLANVKPTKRQASKFRREEGLAYKALRFASQYKDAPREEIEAALTFAGLRLQEAA